MRIYCGREQENICIEPVNGVGITTTSRIYTHKHTDNNTFILFFTRFTLTCSFSNRIVCLLFALGFRMHVFRHSVCVCVLFAILLAFGFYSTVFGCASNCCSYKMTVRIKCLNAETFVQIRSRKTHESHWKLSVWSSNSFGCRILYTRLSLSWYLMTKPNQR